MKTIETSIFSNTFKTSKTFSTEYFGETEIKWNIENVSGISILRYKFSDITEIYEVEYEILKQLKISLYDYFQRVLYMIASQVILMKDGEYDTDIDNEDLEFIRHFEKKYDDLHTGIK